MTQKPQFDTVHQRCLSCAHPNELPYIFCDKCGSSRIRIGRLNVTIFISITMSAFLGYFLFKDSLAWNWPLYLLFAIFFTQFSITLLKGKGTLMLRLYLWYLIFFALFTGIFFLYHTDNHGIIFLILADAPDFAMDKPFIFFPILALALLLIFLPLYFRWVRKYGWVNAYRVVLLTLFILGFLILKGFQVLDWMYSKGMFTDLESYVRDLLLVKDEYTFGR